jgi:hypothetical protein
MIHTSSGWNYWKLGTAAVDDLSEKRNRLQRTITHLANAQPEARMRETSVTLSKSSAQKTMKLLDQARIPVPFLFHNSLPSRKGNVLADILGMKCLEYTNIY